MKISISGIPYEGSPAQSFMKRLYEISSENPLNENARILDNCQVICLPQNGNRAIHISDMKSLLKGSGTIALKKLCSIADLYGTPLTLIALGYGDTPTRVLRRWYAENGFVASGFGSDKDGYRMKREPRRISKNSEGSPVIKLRGFKVREDDPDERIDEAKVIRAGTVRVWKNPTGREILSIANNIGHDLRGLLLRDDVYVWEARTAIHGSIANSLGISREQPFPFYILNNADANDTWKPDGIFDCTIGDLEVYIDKWHVLDFHQSRGYQRMKTVRGFFGF